MGIAVSYRPEQSSPVSGFPIPQRSMFESAAENLLTCMKYVV
jgi:hypothetical protein